MKRNVALYPALLASMWGMDAFNVPKRKLFVIPEGAVKGNFKKVKRKRKKKGNYFTYSE